MNLETVTPMILTFNEQENIGRCLEALRWAKQVLVVDSGSTDQTLEICRGYENVTVMTNPFVSHAVQGNRGLSRITTEWVLSLDADYILSSSLLEELRDLPSTPPCNAYAVGFRYLVFGRPLRATLYPPRKVLYRRLDAQYLADGHSQRIQAPQPHGALNSPIDHDDRKPISRWFESQFRYARLEADKLSDPLLSSQRLTDRIRRRKYFAPFLNLCWCLLVKGMLLEGPAGWYYSFQRMAAELMISICLLDRTLRPRSDI